MEVALNNQIAQSSRDSEKCFHDPRRILDSELYAKLWRYVDRTQDFVGLSCLMSTPILEGDIFLKLPKLVKCFWGQM